MKPYVRPFAAVVLSVALTAPAVAALKPGDAAPLFTTPAAMAGKTKDFDMAKALAKGPVVLYFYPAAFTPGCTQEAHDFADHMDDFAKLGATVVGVSGDPIDKLQKFSVSECRSKFPVAADAELAISKKYDATILNKYANRTSYVIAPDGKVVYAYTSLDPDKHVANLLAALRNLKSGS